MKNESYEIEARGVGDVGEAVVLVGRAMNAAEGRWAERTFGYHFACAEHGIDDGRSYFVWRRGRRIAGLVGLHHYLWGPEGNVWLAWFAVEPDLQRQGHGSALLKSIEAIAREAGYRKLLVETYAHSDFDSARQFYASQGFAEAGRIAEYLDDGSDMIVYGKELRAH